MIFESCAHMSVHIPGPEFNGTAIHSSKVKNKIPI